MSEFRVKLYPSQFPPAKSSALCNYLRYPRVQSPCAIQEFIPIHTENTGKEQDKPFMNTASYQGPAKSCPSHYQLPKPESHWDHKQKNSEALYEKSPISKKTRTEQASVCDTKMSCTFAIHILNVLVSYPRHPYETEIVVHSQESRK